MSRVGEQLLEDAKKNAAADKDSVVDKDLLSLLVKANIAAGAGGQKLTDVDVLARECAQQQAIALEVILIRI